MPSRTQGRLPPPGFTRHDRERFRQRLVYHRSSNIIIKCLIVHSYLMPGNSSKHIILCGHMVIITVAKQSTFYHRLSNIIIKCLIVYSYLVSSNSSKHMILCRYMVDQSHIIKYLTILCYLSRCFCSQ